MARTRTSLRRVFRGHRFDAGEAFGLFVATRQDHVDPIVRKNEPAGTGLSR